MGMLALYCLLVIWQREYRLVSETNRPMASDACGRLWLNAHEFAPGQIYASQASTATPWSSIPARMHGLLRDEPSLQCAWSSLKLRGLHLPANNTCAAR
jgi:hypothetical protein